MKRVLVAAILLIVAGGVFSGCVQYAADRGAQYVEDRAIALEHQNYDRLSMKMEAQGRSIFDIDENRDGTISPTESSRFALSEAPAAAKIFMETYTKSGGDKKAAVKAVKDEYGYIGWGLLSALALPYVHRGVRAWRNGKKKKA